MEGLCAMTIFLFKAGLSTILASLRPWLVTCRYLLLRDYFAFHPECRVSPSLGLSVGCALVLKGTCSLFQKDHG